MAETLTREGLAPAIAELHRIFDAVNERFYGGDLPTPIITIQSQGRKKGVLGWCTTWEAWQIIKATGETEGRFEINLTAEYMNRPVMEILGTLIHEIAHYANAHYGIKDVTGNQYHNKRFKEQAEYLMLEVKQDTKRGWSITNVTPELVEWLKSLNPNESVFTYFRGELPQRQKAPTKMKLWTCGCGTKIRAAVEIDVICRRCGQPFKKQES